MPTSVDPADAGKKTSAILEQNSDEATVQMNQLEEKCYWNDAEFGAGDQVMTDGKCYECSFGRWVQVGD